MSALRVEAVSPRRRKTRLRGTLYLGANTVEFDFYWWPWEVYEEACRTVGFRSCKIEPFLIPAESEQERDEGFWDEYIAAPSAMHIICQNRSYGRAPGIHCL